MAQKGGTVKRFLLTLMLLALLIVAFILLGGGNLLKSAGKWIGGMGKKAEDIKGTLEHKATTIEKTVEKLKESDNRGEKR